MVVEREVRRLEGLGQLGTAESIGDGVKHQVDEADLFLDAEPRALFVGSQHLDDYLPESGMGWVVRLGGLLADTDLSTLTLAIRRKAVRLSIRARCSGL